jgi:hypothetical protein
MKRSVGVLVAISLVIALLAATAASAAVRRVSFTATVSPNDYASVTVSVAPKARCTIKVVYDTVVSKAKGLGPKTGTKITWRWKVGSATHAGRWPVTIDCGRSGKLALRLRVLAD